MRPDTLKKLGRTTWGAGWAIELARATGRNPVTVRRWQAGLTVMSPADHYRVLGACMAASKDRNDTVKRMVATIKSPAEPGGYKPKLIQRTRKPVSRWKKLAKGAVKTGFFAIPPES